MYIPTNDGPNAIPRKRRVAPTNSVDIPKYCFGADDAMMFHIGVFVIANPVTIVERLVDT